MRFKLEANEKIPKSLKDPELIDHCSETGIEVTIDEIQKETKAPVGHFIGPAPNPHT